MPTPYNPEEHHSRDPLYEDVAPRFNPASLDDDATKPADKALLEVLGNQPRRRGRPPGSKNKPKTDTATGQLSWSGGQRPRQTAGGASPPPTDEDIKKRIEAKRRKAKEYEARILKEGNEALMQLFMATGVPAGLLYIKPPEASTLTPNFTPLANRIAIQPMQAKVIGLTMAEWEGSTIGGKMAMGLMRDSPLRLAVLSIASVLMVGQQVKTVMDLKKEFQPFINAYKKSKNPQAQEDSGDDRVSA